MPGIGSPNSTRCFLKVIAMMPVRDEAWVLPHSVAAVSVFCEVILVSDRGSTDGSLEIYKQFPKVVVLNAPLAFRIREQRWQMLDAARGYDGHNLLWASDADEMLSPRLMKGFLERSAGDLVPGAIVDCRYYHLWNSVGLYRDDDLPVGKGDRARPHLRRGIQRPRHRVRARRTTRKGAEGLREGARTGSEQRSGPSELRAVQGNQ